LNRTYWLVVLVALSLAPRGYASDLMGPPTENGPVVVDIGFYVSDIDGINEEEETFEFEGILSLSWTDPRQAFDPKETGYEEKFYQGSYQFAELYSGWWPQVFLANKAGEYEQQVVMLRVRHDGRIIYVGDVNAIAESRLRLRRFPFDTQRFKAVFQVLGFDKSQVILRADETTTGTWDDEDHQVRVPEWYPPRFSTSIREYHPAYGGATRSPTTAFVVQAELQRDPWYMLRLVVLPLSALVILSWSVFWMDRASLSDRMDVSFIGLLTVVAYQIMTSDHIPRISYLTLLAVFLSVSFLMMCASVIVNLVVERLDRTGNHAMGDLVDKRCRTLFPAGYVLSLLVIGGLTYLAN
jgi:hypothetical protein